MSVFWIIIIVAVIAGAQVAYYQKRGLKNVSYTRSFTKKRVFAGDETELVELLENNKLLPVPWVRVESRISPNLRFARQADHDVNMDTFHKSVFFLGAYSRITRRHRITCLRRGYYDCGRVSVVGGDLLGMAADREDLETACCLYVYPRVLRPEELPDSALKWQGDITVRRWILPDPILVNGIREYRAGDSVKDVHWGATARSGQLQVKTRDFTVSPRVLLIFNSQISDRLMGVMQPEEIEFLENGVSLCASLAGWCVESGIEVGLCTNGENALSPADEICLEPKGGQGQLESILEALATLNIKMKFGIHTVLDRRVASGLNGADILLISAYWSETLEGRAQKLRRAGNSVTWLPLRRGVGQ